MGALERHSHACGISRSHDARAVENPFGRRAAQCLHVREMLFHQVNVRTKGNHRVTQGGGCGEGLNTIILAGLGANVFSIDWSEKNLAATCRRACANGVTGNVTLLKSDRTTLPDRDNQADHVLCSSICQYTDPVATARQIRRALRPGGTVVFNETVYTPFLLALSNTLRPQDSINPPRFLTPPLVNAISRAVGVAGRRREFWITVRLLGRLGVSSLSATATFSHRVDARLLRRFAALRQLASQVVWEVRKEK